MKTVSCSCRHVVNDSPRCCWSAARRCWSLLFPCPRCAARPRSPHPVLSRSWWCGSSVIGFPAAPYIFDDPGVLWALSPHYAVGFLIKHGFVGFLVLGSVFLTVTGAEALYADMGHFGRWPIQAAWLFFALPCLAAQLSGPGRLRLWKALTFAPDTTAQLLGSTGTGSSLMIPRRFCAPPPCWCWPAPPR